MHGVLSAPLVDAMGSHTGPETTGDGKCFEVTVG